MRGSRAAMEPNDVFEARIEEENKLAMTIECPLERCLAPIGQPCTAEDGSHRMRHLVRIHRAQKEGRHVAK